MPYMTNETKPHWRTGTKNPHGKVAYSLLTRPEQLEYMRLVNRASYAKKVGGLVRCSPLQNTPERIAQRARDKANLRVTRAKQARFTDELTSFVTSEAHELRKMRNELTGIVWHVDHIVPLKGTQVSGLHIWSNLQVIPKTTNLIKGNSFCHI